MVELVFEIKDLLLQCLALFVHFFVDLVLGGYLVLIDLNLRVGAKSLLTVGVELLAHRLDLFLELAFVALQHHVLCLYPLLLRLHILDSLLS